MAKDAARPEQVASKYFHRDGSEVAPDTVAQIQAWADEEGVSFDEMVARLQRMDKPPATSPRPTDESHPVWCTSEECAWEWSVGQWQRDHCQQLGTVQLNAYGNDRDVTVAIWQTMTAELVNDDTELDVSVWPLEIRLDGDPDDPMTPAQVREVARLLVLAAGVVEGCEAWRPELTVTL